MKTKWLSVFDESFSCTNYIKQEKKNIVQIKKKRITSQMKSKMNMNRTESNRTENEMGFTVWHDCLLFWFRDRSRTKIIHVMMKWKMVPVFPHRHWLDDSMHWLLYFCLQEICALATERAQMKTNTMRNFTMKCTEDPNQLRFDDDVFGLSSFSVSLVLLVVLFLSLRSFWFLSVNFYEPINKRYLMSHPNCTRFVLRLQYIKGILCILVAPLISYISVEEFIGY